jgi:transposase
MPFNPLNPELNPICHLLALLGAHHILHVSGLSVNMPTIALCFTYIRMFRVFRGLSR